MGVFTGETDANGHPMEVQMGNHGAKDAPWGRADGFQMKAPCDFSVLCLDDPTIQSTSTRAASRCE